MHTGSAGRFVDGYVVDVPYLPGFYAHLAPTSLNAAAAVAGVAPVATHDPFSYLELGCGFGDTLLTLAAANPHGRFTGVDINPVHARAMRGRVERAGLTNVRVRESGFAGLAADLEPQHFITLHGVFSWVAEHVRGQILAIARDLLAPGGLLLVSYNALPGWAPLLPVRGLVRELAEGATGDSCERVRAALAIAREMQAAGAPLFAANPQAATVLDDLGTHDDAYLAHEFLNENWTAFAFTDVAGRFASAGLEYVGSLPLANNLPAFWPGPSLLRFIPEGDRVTMEARCDVLMNQSFRWDVYGKEPRRLATLAERLAATGRTGVRLAEAGLTLPWTGTVAGREVRVDGPPHDRLVAVLREGPRSLADLVAAVAADGGPAPASLVGDIDEAVAMGMLRFDERPLPPLEVPRARGFTVPDAFNRDVLARLDARVKDVTLASRRTGTGHGVRVLSALVLACLADDPSADAESDAFIDAVEDRLVRRGPPLAVRSTGEAITDPKERRSAVRAICKDFMRIVLPELVHLGIVVPG